MSNLHILADAASSTATHGVLGGGMSVAAIVGIAWLYHHAHRTAGEMKGMGGGKLKHDPRRTVVIAFLLGALLSTGGGAIGGALAHGAGSVASVLG
jgi:amino acid transporter